jgi:hypothetical protein
MKQIKIYFLRFFQDVHILSFLKTKILNNFNENAFESYY